MVELWQLISRAIFRWLQPTLKKAEIWYRCAWVSCRYPMILFTLVGKANEGTGKGPPTSTCSSKVLHLFYESKTNEAVILLTYQSAEAFRQGSVSQYRLG